MSRTKDYNYPLTIQNLVPLPPKGWRWVLLTEIARLESGHTPSRYRPEWWGGTIPWLALPDIRRLHGKIAFETSENTNEGGITNSSARILPVGTVCLSRTASVGYVTLMGQPMATSQDFANWVCSEEIDPAFLLLLLMASRGYILSLAEGAIHKTVYMPAIKSFKVCIPPLNEQKRVTAILTEQMAAVGKAHAAAEERLKAAKELPTAYLREMFESEETERWPLKYIGNFVKVQSGYAFKSEWFAKSGVRLLRNANVSQGYVDWGDVVHLPNERRSEFAAYELAEGDIVLSLDRPWVSNGLKVSRLADKDLPCLLLQRVGRFCINDGLDSDYLYIFLNSPAFVKAITRHDQSLGVPHVSPKQVEAIEIPVPPRSRQKEIARELRLKQATGENLIVAVEEELKAISRLSAALLRQAFQGEM